jgi:hypothetical protein
MAVTSILVWYLKVRLVPLQDSTIDYMPLEQKEVTDSVSTDIVPNQFSKAVIEKTL